MLSFCYPWPLEDCRLQVKIEQGARGVTQKYTKKTVLRYWLKDNREEIDMYLLGRWVFLFMVMS